MTNRVDSFASDELLNAISSGVAVYRVENDGLCGKDYIILDFNRAALELEGKTRDEVVGRSLYDLRPNIDDFGLIPVFRAVWKTGDPGFFPTKVYVDELFTNFYENRIFRLSEDRIVAVYDDVTARVQSEERVRQQAELHREVMDCVDEAIAVYEAVDDGNDFVFVSVNKGAEVIMHYSAGEVLGRRVSELFPEEASVGLIAKLKEAWITGRKVLIPLKQYQDNRITQWVENTIVRLSSGKVAAIFEDTYEKRMAEEALRETAAGLAEAQAVARIGSWKFNIATGRVSWSREMFRIFDRDLAAGEPFWEEHRERIHPDDWERVDRCIRAAIAEGVPYREEFRIVRRDGSVRTAETIGSADRSDVGAIIGLSGTVQDVTEQRQLEQERLRLLRQTSQSQRLESIGMLASGVAHEINNPLNIVMNYAELIVDHLGDDALVRENARIIVKESERMAGIVRNLLAFSRDGGEAYALAEVRAIIDSTIALIRAPFRRDQIDLSCEIAEGLPKVLCRTQQIQQILLNLLTNSRDALNTHFPGPSLDKKLSVTVRSVERDGTNWVRVTIEDNGGGIPPEIGDHVFDPFMTSKPAGKGTGLGLSISYGLIREHEGELWYESDPGVGTRFHFELRGR